MRKEAILTALETLYIKIAKLQTWLKDWKEEAGRHAWVCKQLLSRVDIPPKVLEAINIEQQVNMMDPDFSFFDWLHNYRKEQERRQTSRDA